MFYYCYAFPLQRTKEKKETNRKQRNTEKLNVKVKTQVIQNLECIYIVFTNCVITYYIMYSQHKHLYPTNLPQTNEEYRKFDID